MASTFAGGSSTAGQPGSMHGFGPAAGNAPYYGGAGEQQQQQPPQSQRLQYYQSPQHATAPATEKIAGRRSGKVKFFDTQKGFGFVLPNIPEELGNEEVFVHYTSISAKSGFRSLAEGEEVEFDIVRGPKGFQAANVTGPGGAQVLGDNRRQIKNTYMPINPYAAMYPYMQQDPSAFYAGASPYNQPMMLLPQGDYRNAPPAHHHAPSPYRNLSNISPYPAANPGLSPYGSPGPLRSLDIGKDFGGMNLGSLSIDDGVRSGSSSKPSNPAPFGGMFGSVPSFDQSRQTNPGAAAFAQQPVGTSSGNLPDGYASSRPTGAVAARSGSFDSGEKPPPSNPSRDRDNSASSRPAALHSRSSSLLYHSSGKGSGSGTNTNNT